MFQRQVRMRLKNRMPQRKIPVTPQGSKGVSEHYNAASPYESLPEARKPDKQFIMVPGFGKEEDGEQFARTIFPRAAQYVIPKTKTKFVPDYWTRSEWTTGAWDRVIDAGGLKLADELDARAARLGVKITTKWLTSIGVYGAGELAQVIATYRKMTQPVVKRRKKNK